MPVYQLLGGKFRDSVRLYADCHAGSGLESWGPALLPREPEWYRQARAAQGEDSVAPSAYAAKAREAVGRGFDALKFDLDAGSVPSEGQNRALAADGDGHHLRARGFMGLHHDGERRILPGADDEARCERTAGNDERIWGTHGGYAFG